MCRSNRIRKLVVEQNFFKASVSLYIIFSDDSAKLIITNRTFSSTNLILKFTYTQHIDLHISNK